jgi:hypothetical protein
MPYRFEGDEHSGLVWKSRFFTQIVHVVKGLYFHVSLIPNFQCPKTVEFSTLSFMQEKVVTNSGGPGVKKSFQK